jgi:CrcB protein
MGPQVIASIFVGAGLGALLRHGLNLALGNGATVPLGTLAANLLGGYLVGLAAGFFLLRADVPEAWRLFAVTGVLGGLTTFSTFSLELAGAVQNGRLMAAGAIALAHLAGSLLLTLAGLATARAIFGAPLSAAS